MIEDTLKKLESAAAKIASADSAKKAELLELLATLKAEIHRLDAEHEDQARSIAGFTDAAAHEATRRSPAPPLLKLALDGLAQSSRAFETSHPKLVETIGEICRKLASLGI